MLFREVLALRGPNVWANSPVLEAWVELGDRAETSSAMVPGMVDRLMAWLPGLIEHECSEGHRGGFLVRLREGTYPAHMLEHVTLELQCLAGTPVGYGRARETSEPGVYRVVVKYKEEELGRACLEAGRRLILAGLEGEDFDAEGEVERLRDLYDDVRLGPPTAAIFEAARARGIPSWRLEPGRPVGKLFPLGQGVKQRRFLSSRTDGTGSIADKLSEDKELTKTLLRSVGVPVPVGRPVEDAEDAWEAAEDLGLPVVVKPRDSDFGRGVALRLTTREQVISAYEAARPFGEGVLVERCAPGIEHRLLIVDGRLVAAIRREPPLIVGDGRSTVAGLVERANLDPRRGLDNTSALRKIAMDEVALAVLAEQDSGLEAIPAEGERVLLRRNAHRRFGGSSVDVTDEVHLEVAARAIEAARVVGLDVAGIDVVADDIGRPLEAQGGVVIEVNAEPALLMHLEPSEGQARPVAEAILASLFPEGEDGRIPLVAVTGTRGKTTTTTLIGTILREDGKVVGMATSDGTAIDGRRIDPADGTGSRAARNVLLHPRVEAAALECGLHGIAREGLGFDRCAVGVVTNIGDGDHLGLADLQTLEKLAQVKRTIVEVVLPDGAAVLKADDPLVAGMAEHCRGSVVYFCRDADHEVIRGHLAAGGRAVLEEDGQIVMAEGNRRERLVGLDLAQTTELGRRESLLAAVGAGWSLGITREVMSRALANHHEGKVNQGRDRIARPGIVEAIPG